MYSVYVCVCGRMHALVCQHIHLCAFIHVLPVTSSPMWTVNTERFKVGLTRACVGCHLLSFSSQIKKWKSRVQEGISFFLFLIPIMSEQERREEAEMWRRCIRFVKICLVRLVRQIWIARFPCLAVVSSEEAVWPYKCHAPCLEFAGWMPLDYVCTICTHKNIGTICCCAYRKWSAEMIDS